MVLFAFFLSFFLLETAEATVSGLLELEGLSSFSKPSEPVEPIEGRVKASLEYRYRFRRQFIFRLHLYSQISSQPQAWSERIFFDPKELYLGADFSQFYLHAGYFTLRYEGTDGLNPMDIGSMKNWSDPLSPLTRASAGLHFGYTGNTLEIEAAYVPYQTESTIPGKESAWLPRRIRFPLRSEDIDLLLPEKVEYQIARREVLDRSLYHNYSSRVQLRTDFGDAALAFFEGASDVPLITPTLDVVPISVAPKQVYRLLSPVTMTPKIYRRRSVSGFMTKPIGEWIVRISSRYDQPLGLARTLMTWSAESVAGVERTFLIWSDQVTFVLQGSLVHSPESQSLVSINDLLNRAILFGVRWPVGDAWTFQLSSLYSTSDQSGYYTFLAARSFGNWSSRVTLELLEGPPDSVIGIFDHNDRISFQLARIF